MRIAVLGPLEVSGGRTSAPATVATPKERAVLEILATRAPEAVSDDTLIEALWGDDPPATARRTLASHVSRLRKAIGSELVTAEQGGHRLDTAIADVDVWRVRELVDEAERHLDHGRPDLASEAARVALASWRGEPLTDLADTGLRRGEHTRLEELRRRARTARIDAELALGHHERVIGELEALVHREPLHEPWWVRLMTALYRSGRQADALRAFGRLRDRLRDELGVDPGNDAARVELAILRQDPSLDVPPLQPPSNLPHALGRFIGRTDEMRSIEEQLDARRLVTLVGPGGIGKSRLALEVASRRRSAYPDGTWWIDLAPIRSSSGLVEQFATCLGITGSGDITADTVIQHLGRRSAALLVVDNCEHLRSPVAALLNRILDRVSSIRVLATSRERLGLPGEMDLHVPPMSFPSPDDRTALDRFDSVELFVERAGENGRPLSADDLDEAGAVCRRLDGVPLAIELAASRVRGFTPRQLRERLDEHILAPERHDIVGDPRYTSLDEAIAWSCDLLDDVERRLLYQLSVFDDPFDAEAVAAVGSIDTVDPVDALAALVDASLVAEVAETYEDGTPWFRLLATVREHATAHLPASDRDGVEQRRADHFRRIAGDTGGLDVATAVPTAERVERLVLHRHDVASALDWSCTHDDPETAVRFSVAVAVAWYYAGRLDRAIEILDRALALPASTALSGWATFQQVWPLALSGRVDRATAALDHADQVAEQTNDDVLAASVAHSRAHAHFLTTGDIDASIPLYDRALALGEQVHAGGEVAAIRLGLAQALVLADRPERVPRLLDDARGWLRDHPDDAQIAHLRLDEALLAWCLGHDDAIRDRAASGRRHAQLAGTRFWEQVNLAADGFGALETGDLDDAGVALRRAARWAVEDDNLVQLGIPLDGLAALAALRGDDVLAAELSGAATAVRPDWPLMRRRIDEHLASARERLGARFTTHADEGRRLTPEEALALAAGT